MEKDVDTGYVGGIQDRLEHPVGEAQPEDVEHRGRAEVVVDAVDLVLRHQTRRDLVERVRLAAPLPNGFSITSRVVAGRWTWVSARHAWSATAGGSAKYTISWPGEDVRSRRSRSCGAVTSACT